MSAQLTAVFRQVPEGFIGWVEEIPGANVQEATLAEARESLAEAVDLVLAANRELAQAALGGATDVIREPFRSNRRREAARSDPASRSPRGTAASEGRSTPVRQSGGRTYDDRAAARRDQRSSGAQDLPRSGGSGP